MGFTDALFLMTIIICITVVTCKAIDCLMEWSELKNQKPIEVNLGERQDKD